MKLELYSYSVPFNKPFRISGRTYNRREGLLLMLHTDDDVFLSEAAPLPGFSSESVSEAADAIRGYKAWKTLFGFEYRPEGLEELPASVQFALSSLWYMRRARMEGKKLQDFLSDGARIKIPVNTAIGIGKPENVLMQVEKGHQAGFRTFKFKTGRDTAEEKEMLEAVRKKWPDIRIRIDANGAWETDEALEALQAFAPADIEYCEQPVAPGDDESLAWLSARSPVPVAADESLRSFDDARRIITRKLAGVLIVKPMLTGSVDAYLDILKMARQTGSRVVVTTSLDSGIGRRITAALASFNPESRYAQGLATGAMLKSDPAPDSHLIDNGYYLAGQLEERPPFETDSGPDDVFTF